MNLSRIFSSIQRYGLRGIVDYLLRLRKDRVFRRRMEASMIHSPEWQPERGLTLIGPVSSSASLGKVLRDFALLLDKAGIPHQVLDTNDKPQVPESEFRQLLTPPGDFHVNRYDHIVGMFALPPLPAFPSKRARIVFAEFETGFVEDHPEMLEPTDVIVMSNFNYEVLTKSVPPPISVKKILYPFQFDARAIPEATAIRAKYGLTSGDFVVFFNFDYRSGYGRKNPEGVVRAFAKAFRETPNAKLVFKTMRTKAFPDAARRHAELCEREGIADRVLSIDSFIPQEDLVGLTNACDVYISLHRGEGFGLGIAEAMTLGKPVVVTNYSAPTEFCNKDNALLVPYKLTPVKPGQLDIAEYKHVTHWAEPDIDAAAAALRTLYDHPDLRTKIGKNAQTFIKDYFSVKNFTRSIENYLRHRAN